MTAENLCYLFIFGFGLGLLLGFFAAMISNVIHYGVAWVAGRSGI